MTLADRIFDRLAAEGLQRARAAMGSQTLKRALRFQRLTPLSGRLYVPHYWALYHHDGRGAVFPVRATVLVWFRDPKDDPRLAGGYPVRLNEIKRLTRAQYLAGLERNKELYKRNPSLGKQQFMIVRPFAGPTTKSYPFFTRGLQGMLQVGERIIREEMIKELQSVSVREVSSAILRM